jgi:hypothetical protein
MTAVSQRIPNFLGGVSQQADEKLFPGQVKDALNCYPDTTLGMIKRPGGRFLSKLSNIGTAKALDNDAWFTIFRDDASSYVVSIIKSTGVVRVWDLSTGVEKTVTDTTGTRTYLTATDYRSLKWLTINDFTYLLNTEKTVTTKAVPTWNAKRQATIVVSSVEYDTKYKVTIGATTYTYTSRTNYVTGTPPPQVLPLELSEIVNGISTAITAGFTTKEIIDNTIYLTFSSDTDVKGEAGPDGKFIRVFQDSVDTFNRLPEQAKHNQVVKVVNTSADKDDFYLKFVAENSTSGKGYWEETRSPSVSPGINPATMPVVLLRLGSGNFQVAPLDATVTVNNLALEWEDRLVGDEESNEHPSFVNNKIKDIFLFNNRLGFLTQDNVSMSQAGDYFNFYHKSATTQVISDPIDLSCSSIKPAVLHAVVPISQGLLLFSDNQQFLMEAENGAWTPANVTIRTISNYEGDTYIKPADLGSTVMFVSRNQSWTRTFEIFTRGQREAPTVSESSKIVPEWIPQEITSAIGSAQNGLWIGSGRTLNDIYMFRYYEEGDERKMASWVRWELPSNIIHTDIQQDVLYVITSGDEGYTVLSHKLVLSPTTGGLTNYYGNKVDPHFDSWFEITTTPTFANGVTKVYIPSHYDTTKEMQYVVGLLKVNPTNLTESGLSNVITVLTDGGGKYFEIPGNVTGNYIYIGYSFQMELVLPRYNYSLGDQGYDFTGYTTTARMKFYTGLGGAVYFNVKDNTRTEWTEISGIQIADVYPADSSPFRDFYIYKVPIYQRPDNYIMKVLSKNPYPISLVAMQWEGQYSSGFYRKA